MEVAVEQAKDRRSSEASEGTSPTRIQRGWNNVKTNFKSKSSLPELRRWWSSSRVSAPNEGSSPPEERWPQDEKESQFCESLLGLMQRTGRFDYIQFPEEKKTSAEGVGRNSSEAELAGQSSPRQRTQRFSWVSR